MPPHDRDPQREGSSPVHVLIAESSNTDVAEWQACEGPRPGSVALHAWFVRRRDGQPDVYAVVSGDEDDATVELIPAGPGEDDAYAVARGCHAGREAGATPDIECGVVHRGPMAAAGPAP